MRRKNTISPSEVEFWMDSDKYSNFIEEGVGASNKTLVFNIDMIKLSSIRAAISNFVRILTRKSIPVYFNDNNVNSNFMGKIIHISAKINTMQEFDCAVGQALHEGAHTLKSDFDMAKAVWANIPHKIFKLSDSKNIRRASLEKFIHGMWNIIEDRYIDNYVFNAAPGYRGYYVAFYDNFWNSPKVDEYLVSEYFRYPSLKSYDFRICNFTNENTELDALPNLEEIAKVIDISHIDRLETTKDRLETAFQVVEIVLDTIGKQVDAAPGSGAGGKQKRKDGLADPNDFFDFGDDFNDSGEEVDVGKKMINEMSDIMNGKGDPNNSNENDKLVNQIMNGNVDSETLKEIDDIVKNQQKFLRGEVPKEVVTDLQKALLDLIEKHGITLVRVDLPTLIPGDSKTIKVDCIVVHKMTKELVIAGQSVFPLSGVMKMGSDTPEPPESVAKAVRKGILLGTKLGRKLQIRAEINPTKIIRKRSGKVNKRQLHEAAFDAEDLFYKIIIDEHHKATLHISVDASGSMAGEKWERTMTAVVAICKAASMIDNVHITVSFRSTQVSGSSQLPYIILAYDSAIDKFSKVKSLFPYLVTNGCTPEGLAFGAIMNLFEEITPDEEDRYFLNLSDGEPYYSLYARETGLNINYHGEVAVTHTKSQVDKIKSYGVEVLSYFIGESGDNKSGDNNPLRKNFRKMYGKDAKFIDVESIVDLARTINGLFLIRNTNNET